ncbi:hypothetical protein Sjap_017556 [Stephania japonica]|uniref:Uncharacterized protein n=1 Tax=Stephania japonica TaxID=461633 RepID=A0AAP0NM46_9MAGN
MESIRSVGCKFVGSSEQLSQHFKDNHSSERTEFAFGKPFSVRVKLYEPFVALQSSDGPMFLLNNFSTITSNSFTIASLGNNNSKFKNLYHLTLKTGDDILTFSSRAKVINRKNESSTLNSCSSLLLLDSLILYWGSSMKRGGSLPQQCKIIANNLNLIDVDPFAEVARMESNSSSSNKRKRPGEEVEAKAKVLKVCISSGNNNDNGNGGIPVLLSDPALLDCNICLNPLSPPIFQKCPATAKKAPTKRIAVILLATAPFLSASLLVHPNSCLNTSKTISHPRGRNSLLANHFQFA